MKTIWIAIPATAVVTAVVTLWTPWRASSEAVRADPPMVAEAVAKNGTVTYAPDAAQLSYLRVEPMRVSPAPLVGSLAACSRGCRSR